jgi:hypothetical protein
MVKNNYVKMVFQPRKGLNMKHQVNIQPHSGLRDFRFIPRVSLGVTHIQPHSGL